LTLGYSVRIIFVSRPVSSSSNQTNSRALAQAERFLIYFNRKYTVFEAFMLICTLGLPPVYGNCEEVRDTRGPYTTKKRCETRIEEMLKDLPEYRPYSYLKAYKCDEPTTTNQKFT